MRPVTAHNANGDVSHLGRVVVADDLLLILAVIGTRFSKFLINIGKVNGACGYAVKIRHSYNMRDV